MQRATGTRVPAAMGLIVLLAGAAVAGCGARTTGTVLPGGAENGKVTATEVRAGETEVREIIIQEPPSGESYREGGVARMGAVLTTDGDAPDLLLGVQTPIATDTQLFADTTPDDNSYTPTPVPQIAGKPATSTGPSGVPFYVELRDLTTPAREGQTYPVTFRFQKAGSVQATVPVDIAKGP